MADDDHRNLTTDHLKAGRTRLEYATEDMSPDDSATEGPETSVLASIANESLLAALTDCRTSSRSA